jgi:hypothetical protein
MGITLSATEAARLTGVTERTMRAWLAAGKIPGAHKQAPEQAAGKGPVRWEIDSDQLAQVPGITLDRDALAVLEARGRRSPGGVLARLDALEAQVRALSARVRALEASSGSSGNSNAPVTRSEAQEGASMAWDRESYHPTPDRLPVDLPSASFSLRYGTDAPPDAAGRASGATFRTRADAARWLMRHGIASEGTPKTWPGWRDVELTPGAVLALAVSLCDPSNHRITWRLHPCGDTSCVCHELLS